MFGALFAALAGVGIIKSISNGTGPLGSLFGINKKPEPVAAPMTNNSDFEMDPIGENTASVNNDTYPIMEDTVENSPSPEKARVVSTAPSGAIATALSGDKEQRIKDIVASARSIYPDNDNMARLAASQAILESRLLGEKPSGLATKYNNLFGIKGKGTAGSANMQTWEVLGGKKKVLNDNFAHNNSIADSFAQHRDLMLKSRYKSVWDQPDFSATADAVRRAGYATDPAYSNKLKNINQKYLSPYFP